MDKLDIAVCDDECAQRSFITALAHRWADVRGIALHLSEHQSAENLLICYEDAASPDILLLDIQMGGMDGMALAREIRRTNEHAQIIFITGYTDFIAEGYDVAALNYLIKPVKEDKFFDVLDKARERLNRVEKSIILPGDGDIIRIPIKIIKYIEAQGHYINVVTEKETYRRKMALSDIQASLDDAFFRCQRSFIVNLQYIKRITRTDIVLDNDVVLPLSRGLYDAANRAVIQYFK